MTSNSAADILRDVRNYSSWLACVEVEKKEKGFPKWEPACALTETLLFALSQPLALTHFILSTHSVFLFQLCFNSFFFMFNMFDILKQLTRFGVPLVVFYILFGFSVVCLFFNIRRRLIYFVLCSLLLFLSLSFFLLDSRPFLFFFFFFHVFPPPFFFLLSVTAPSLTGSLCPC